MEKEYIFFRKGKGCLVFFVGVFLVFVLSFYLASLHKVPAVLSILAISGTSFLITFLAFKIDKLNRGG